MILQTDHTQLLWPLVLYGIAVILLVVGMLAIAYLIGERHKETATDEIYESGIKVTGSARLRFPVHFYLVTMFFVIFDVAAVFIIAWSISIHQVGWTGYTTIAIFIGIIASVLLYIWKMGALDFGPDSKKILKAYHDRIKRNREPTKS